MRTPRTCRVKKGAGLGTPASPKQGDIVPAAATFPYRGLPWVGGPFPAIVEQDFETSEWQSRRRSMVG